MLNLRRWLFGAVFYSLAASTALAQVLPAENTQSAYVSQKIVATHVKGLHLSLSTTTTRRDCNRRLISISTTVGQDDLSHPVYKIKTHLTMTKMHCPLTTPLTEIIHSKKLFLPATADPFILTLLIPKEYKATLVEIR
jgi:hypothetical protein